MKILLDTHVFLWALVTPERLSDEAVELLADGAYEKYLSAASAWEIICKYADGKIVLPVGPEEFVTKSLLASGILSLPLTVQDALVAGELPSYHDDAVDRQLVAQALRNQMFIMTDDSAFEMYEVKIIDI